MGAALKFRVGGGGEEDRRGFGGEEDLGRHISRTLIAQLVKNLPAMQETLFYPWVGKIPWRRESLPTPVFWTGGFHGLCSPWGCKESDMTVTSLPSCKTSPPSAPIVRGLTTFTWNNSQNRSNHLVWGETQAARKPGLQASQMEDPPGVHGGGTVAICA